MAEHDVEYGWWEYTYECFEEVIKTVFNAELDTKGLHFDCYREHISYNTTLRPTAESLAKADKYGPQMQELANELKEMVALFSLAGYEFRLELCDGRYNNIIPEDDYDEDELEFIEAFVDKAEAWCRDLSHWMLKSLTDEYEYLLALPEDEEEDIPET